FSSLTGIKQYLKHPLLNLKVLIYIVCFPAIILTSYFWGWLADTQGRRPVMLFSMIISAVFSVFASFSPDIISFGVLQFISAIFMAGSSAVVYTYLGEFNNLRHRDKMVAFGSSLCGHRDCHIALCIWLNIPPQEFAFSHKFPGHLLPSLEAAHRGLRYSLRTGLWHPSLCSESPKFLFAIWNSMKEQTIPLFKMPLVPWTLLTCFVQFGIFATTNGFYVWFPSILNSLANHDGGETKICDVLDASKAAAANGTDVICDDTMNTATFERSIYIGLVFCSMYIIVGFLVDFVGKKLILLTILSVTGLCGICAHLAYNQQLAVVLFAVFQMSGACIGLMNAVAVELFPTKFRAMAICLSMMMGRVGSMVGSNLIGMFLETNCGAGFYLFGGILIVNAICCLTLPAKKTIQPSKMINVESTQNQTHEPV
ncbi:uncharacterized protein LOC119190112, partial [Manduca sexta]|uniref:uncharacterized protein LOC119190112 n=1 Tax=Manduca sexta TaxID=7130 RepID=UPI00188F6896